MLVKDFMTRHPIMVSPESPAAEAHQIMTTNAIRHLPVIGDGKRLVGMLTTASFSIAADSLGSLNVWEISRRLSNLHVKDVMTRREDVVTIPADTTVERAAKILNDARQNALVVVEDEKIVVGIVTNVDIMNTLQEMLGLMTPGVRVTIRIPNRKGEFKKIAEVIAQNNWGIMGIGSYPSPRSDGSSYDVVLKLPEVTIEDVKAVFNDVADQEIVDVRLGG